MSLIRLNASALVLGLAACTGASHATQEGVNTDYVIMPNGHGLGMNGHGLGMNGPALGQYPDFPTKQGAIGLAWVTFSNATTIGGAHFQSVGLVRGELQGTLADGTRLTGDQFFGVILQARGL